MPLILSTEDFNTVQEKRKRIRPVRYSAGTGTWVTVGLDYEAFLILTPVGKKSSASNWINLQTLSLDESTFRDIVAEDFLTREILEVEQQKAILLLLTELYDEFRSDFIDERFQGVNEVATLLEDTRLGADRFFALNDELEHRRIMAAAMQTRYSSGLVSDERRRQASSWSISLLTPYL